MPSLWYGNYFHSPANKTDFHKKGCALVLWGFLELRSGLFLICEDFAWKTRFDGKRATKKASTGTNIRAHYFQSYWYDYHDLRSSRPKNISPEVMSPEILSQVPRNAELCGSKFYHAQKHPSILITHLSPLFHCSTRVKERDILQIYTPTFVSSLFKERGMLHLHSARFVSWYSMISW